MYRIHLALPLTTRLLSLFLLSVLSLPHLSLVLAQNGPTTWSATPFNPPALPLAVRSPYLNTWLQQGNNPAPLNDFWPNLWTINAITGWYASITVDGAAYKLLGAASDVPANISLANQTALEWTATRSTVMFQAGPVLVNVSFVSPIEPTDLVRQSLPFSYMTMSVSSTDGSAHAIRLYSDISGEFITGDTAELATWDADDEGQYVVLSMQLQIPQKYTEVNNHAQDAVEYYAFRKISGTTTSWAITEDRINRARAANMTSLGNVQDAPPRGVDVNWPTLGIAVDWQSITSTPEPAVWAIGVMRSPSILYKTPSGTNQERYSYFQTVWSDGVSATKAFLDDYTRAISASSSFDASIASLSASVTGPYASALALVSRQVMSSLDITISRTGGGVWNSSDVKVFMKNMGSGGSDASSTGTTITSVNTVDVLYAAFPMFLYLNPELGGYLLAPLLEYQDSSMYTQSYAARYIGASYPNATADRILDTHDYRIEECANMLIMTLAYSQRSGNGTFISRHYTLLRKWADYLVNNTLTPTNEKSADYLSTLQVTENNQTNLALKGIIGIAAMSKMADLAGVDGDRDRYNNSANSLLSQWQTGALASDNSHINFVYGDSDTNGLIYNLYADKLLQLGLVSDQVYEVATVFYNNIASQSKYGLPLDNQDGDRAGAHWMMFSASTVTNLATRDYMINQINDYMSSNHNNTPVPAYYSPSSGVADRSLNAGKNSPALGALYSLLALNTTIKSDIDIPQDGSTIPNVSSSSSSNSNTGAIAGGVVGGIAGAALIGIGVFFCLRKCKQREQSMYDTHVKPMLPTNASFVSPSSFSSRPKLATDGDGATLEPFVYGETTQTTQTPSGRALTTPGVESNAVYAARTGGAGGATPGAGAVAGTAQNARDSTYFRTHRPRESDDIGPSASQFGSGTTSSGAGTRSGRAGSASAGGGGAGRGGGYTSTSDGTSPQQVMLAKQTLVNEELRSEVDNLRRDLERIRVERQMAALPDDEAPPSYDDPLGRI